MLASDTNIESVVARRLQNGLDSLARQGNAMRECYSLACRIEALGFDHDYYQGDTGLITIKATRDQLTAVRNAFGKLSISHSDVDDAEAQTVRVVLRTEIDNVRVQYTKPFKPGPGGCRIETTTYTSHSLVCPRKTA